MKKYAILIFLSLLANTATSGQNPFVETISEGRIFGRTSPEFAFVLPEMAGNVKFGLVGDGADKWVKDADRVTVSRSGNMLVYSVRDAMLGKGEITFSVVPLKTTDGIVIEVLPKEIPAGINLIWAFGGSYGEALEDGDDMSLKPLYARNNVFSVEESAFTVYYAKSMALKVFNGITPVTSEIVLADAHKQESPKIFFESGKKTDSPALAGRLPLVGGQKEYFCFYRQNATDDYNRFMLPEVFEKHVKR